MSTPQKTSRLQRVLARVEGEFGVPPAPALDSVFAHVVWENIAYLQDDAHRAAAFAALQQATRMHAEAVLALPRAELTAFCAQGGIHAAERAGRLQDAARLWLHDFRGDDRAILDQEPKAALKALQQFPAIGRPGAEKILLHTGRLPVLALESNGLRALLRLGYGQEHKGYDQSYRSAQEAAAPELPAQCKALQRAHALLKELGRQVCKRSAPLCAECPARALCPTGSPGNKR